VPLFDWLLVRKFTAVIFAEPVEPTVALALADNPIEYPTAKLLVLILFNPKSITSDLAISKGIDIVLTLSSAFYL